MQTLVCVNKNIVVYVFNVAFLITHAPRDHAAGNNIIKNYYDYPKVRIYGGCNEPVLEKTQ